jgi:hypothetical protein
MIGPALGLGMPTNGVTGAPPDPPDPEEAPANALMLGTEYLYLGDPDETDFTNILTLGA